jgi:hypothetical protein
VEALVTIGQNDPAAEAGRGRLRASHADREQVIDTLNIAFADGRLGQDERETRVSQALASRTYADLAALTADIPAFPAPVPPRPAARPLSARPAARPLSARPLSARPLSARPPSGTKAVKRALAAMCAVIPPVFFFEAVFRSNETLAEAFFLLMLVDLIVLTLAASNSVLSRLEDHRVSGARGSPQL